MMAMSVNRRSERNLPIVMGRRDPEAMIRVRSTDPIRASGLVPRQQAGHMTASDLTSQNAKKTLASWGPSTHDGNVRGRFLFSDGHQDVGARRHRIRPASGAAATTRFPGSIRRLPLSGIAARAFTTRLNNAERARR